MGGDNIISKKYILALRDVAIIAPLVGKRGLIRPIAAVFQAKAFQRKSRSRALFGFFHSVSNNGVMCGSLQGPVL